MKLSNTALFYRMEREKAMYWLSTKKAKIIMLLPTLMIYEYLLLFLCLSHVTIALRITVVLEKHPLWE